MTRAAVCTLAALGLGCLGAGVPEKPREIDPDEARAAMARCVAFLLADQNADGSWGGPREAIWTFSGSVWTNPATHEAWTVATTGLCCAALLDADRSEISLKAVDRAVDYLLEHGDVGRPSEWDTMDCWSNIYGLQGLARVYVDPHFAADPRRERCKLVAAKLLRNLAGTQAFNGGWGYLEFNPPRTRHEQWATSFTTAAAIVAMIDARQAGFEVDDKMFRLAVRAVEHCRLPTGAYTYAVPIIPLPGSSERINNIKGSLCRIQSCNLALLLAGRTIPVPRLREGLTDLFRHHRFIDIARSKPIPHESYYQNSGYFYLFGHYYAARLVNQLPAEMRAEFWPRLRYEVVKLQQEDGSMFDYDMHAYHKPYGTAYGLMTLAESLK